MRPALIGAIASKRLPRYVRTDPYFSSVKSLLHFEGADASTTFTDVKGKTWTAAGTAQIDTAQYKMQTASGLFGGSGNHIDTPDSGDFALGTSDFTIEGWLYIASGSQYFGGQCAASATNTSVSFLLTVATTGSFRGYCCSGGSVIGDASVAGWAASTWAHFAYVRNGTSFTAYRNGVGGTPSAASALSVNDSTNKLAWGRAGEYTSSGTNTHYLDDCRITVGVARYTANFTPPEYPFPDL